MLTLLVRRPRQDNEPHDEEGFAFLDTTSPRGLFHELKEVIPIMSERSLPMQHVARMEKALMRPDAPHVEEGDLFAATQVEPLGALMLTAGIHELITSRDVVELRARLKFWRAIPDERKLFQIFGDPSYVEDVCTCLSHLILAGWRITITDETYGMPPLTNLDFIKTLKEETP